MKVIVLNGSPKGETSVTMQYVAWIQKRHPEHRLKIVNVAQRIKSLESNAQKFNDIIDEVRGADAVLWAFPLYVFTVPSQYIRFIELIWENGAMMAFADKYAAALSTSIHFYDHTAHQYINGVCDDLAMKYLGYYSADMYDLMKEKERARLDLFAGNFFSDIEKKRPTVRNSPLLPESDFTYAPGAVAERVPTRGKKILILTDSDSPDTNLGKMIARFSGAFEGRAEVVNLFDLDVKGGCLGCLRCGYDNVCAYEGSDGFNDFYRQHVEKADILVFAATIKNRYLDARWKMVYDRAFFNGHVPTLLGRQMAVLISGPIRQVPYLQDIYKAHAQLQQSNLLDIISDEDGDSARLDRLLQDLAGRAIGQGSDGYVSPPTFLAVGGMKIFRDAVYGKLRLAFRADHRQYTKRGYYDFPHKTQRKEIVLGEIIGFLQRFPPFRKEFKKVIKERMIEPLKHVLERSA